MISQSSVPAADPQAPPAPAPVRWGVLGAAGIALNKVIPAMQRGTWSRVVALASRDEGRAAAAEMASDLRQLRSGLSASWSGPSMVFDRDLVVEVQGGSVTGGVRRPVRQALAVRVAVTTSPVPATASPRISNPGPRLPIEPGAKTRTCAGIGGLYTFDRP